MKRFFKLNIILVLICMLLNVVGCGTQYLGGSRDEKWQKDLNYLKEALPKKHIDLFFNTTEDEFNNKIDELKNNVSTLSDEEVVTGIYELVASVGDAHTKAYKDYEKRYPVWFYYFNDGLYLINTTENYSEAINCKLKKVNGIEIDKIKELLEPLIAKENEWNIKKVLPTFLMRPDILKGVGIASDTEKSIFTFENSNNNEFDVEINSVDLSNDDNEIKLISNDDESSPLYRQNSDLTYWYKYIEENNTLYFKYNLCSDDEECGHIEDVIKEMIKIVDENNIDKFIIDMRNNSGGRPIYLNLLISELKERDINDSNRLFVITGRETFSAAIVNACQLREETNSFFVGEPTSGKPNHYGEVQHFKLPNSKIDIAYSTNKITVFNDVGNAFVPDKEIDLSINDYVNKYDPVVDYILNK